MTFSIGTNKLSYSRATKKRKGSKTTFEKKARLIQQIAIHDHLPVVVLKGLCVFHVNRLQTGVQFWEILLGIESWRWLVTFSRHIVVSTLDRPRVDEVVDRLLLVVSTPDIRWDISHFGNHGLGTGGRFVGTVVLGNTGCDLEE